MKFVMEGKHRIATIKCSISTGRSFRLYVFRVILEADPGCVVQKVALRTDDIPIGEQTVAQVSTLLWLIHHLGYLSTLN